MAKAPKADSLLIELENAVNKINFSWNFMFIKVLGLKTVLIFQNSSIKSLNNLIVQFV
jgi:hypothetical protein